VDVPLWMLIGLVVVAALLAVVLLVAPTITRTTEGKILAFAGLFLVPAFVLYAGASEHLERSKSTDFCLSCHIMTPYGKSLRVNDGEYVAAAHFQNNRVPQDHACYSCHTDYALFGGIRSKLRGLRHVLVNYSGTAPDTIKLYQPYNNRECLHCHGAARSFLEASAHADVEGSIAGLKAGTTSCIASGCHDVIHDVRGLENVELWDPAKPAETAPVPSTAADSGAAAPQANE